MIKPVEHLSETERVFRKHRKLQRSNDLLHDLIEARRFENQGPQLVAPTLARELGRSRRGKPFEHGGFVQPIAAAQLREDVLGAYDSIL